MNDLMHLFRLTVWKFMGSSKPPSSDPCIHTPNVSPRRLALFSGRSNAPDFFASTKSGAAFVFVVSLQFLGRVWEKRDGEGCCLGGAVGRRGNELTSVARSPRYAERERERERGPVGDMLGSRTTARGGKREDLLRVHSAEVDDKLDV